MSIQEEVERIATAKDNIKNAIEIKGVEVGDGTIDTYAEKVLQISGGGGGGDVEISIPTAVMIGDPGTWPPEYVYGAHSYPDIGLDFSDSNYVQVRATFNREHLSTVAEMYTYFSTPAAQRDVAKVSINGHIFDCATQSTINIAQINLEDYATSDNWSCYFDESGHVVSYSETPTLMHPVLIDFENEIATPGTGRLLDTATANVTPGEFHWFYARYVEGPSKDIIDQKGVTWIETAITAVDDNRNVWPNIQHYNITGFQSSHATNDTVCVQNSEAISTYAVLLFDDIRRRVGGAGATMPDAGDISIPIVGIFIPDESQTSLADAISDFTSKIGAPLGFIQPHMQVYDLTSGDLVSLDYKTWQALGNYNFADPQALLEYTQTLSGAVTVDFISPIKSQFNFVLNGPVAKKSLSSIMAVNNYKGVKIGTWDDPEMCNGVVFADDANVDLSNLTNVQIY